jgi:hypothetical protein
MANEQQAGSLLATMLAHGLINIGPVDRGVMFPMARLVYWDMRDPEVIELYLQAGDSVDMIRIDGEIAAKFRSDLTALSSITAADVERQMRENLQEKPVNGRKQ